MELAPLPWESCEERFRSVLGNVLVPRRHNVVFDAVTRALNARIKCGELLLEWRPRSVTHPPRRAAPRTAARLGRAWPARCGRCAWS